MKKAKIFGGLIFILFIIFPNEVKEGTKLGLENGLFVLLPSLFTYMVISRVFIKTGGADFISSAVYKPLGALTGLSKKGVSIYIISLFCGYPTGARLASISYNDNEIDKNEAKKLFAAGNIPGFGFCAAFLGGNIFNSAAIGIKIFISFILSSVILEFILSRFLKNQKNKTMPENEYESLQNALISSIIDGGAAIITVIAFVCFFSAIIKIISVFIKNKVILAISAAFVEITTGIPLLIKYTPNPIYAVIFFTGFSGLSIIFQSLSFQKKNITNIFFFIIIRIVYATLATIIFFIIHNS